MDRVLQRRDTASNWAKFNPVLSEGEIGIVIDGGKGYKIGDGVTHWNDLEYPSNPTSVVGTIGDSEVAVINQKGVSSLVGLDTYPVFSDTKPYVKGEIVNYGGLLYEFTADHEAGAWIGTDVKETSLKNYLLNNDIKSMSFSGKAYVDLGSMANYLSDGSFDKYINDPLYDCVWVYIYPNCTNLNISGATHSLIGYFKDIIPSTNNYLGRDFKENAVLCLINLKR